MSSTSQIDTLFSGISNTSSYPPHNGLAVGPSYIVMAEGSRIEWTNLTGGAATIQSVYSFFGSLGGTATNSLYDPRCIYDSASGRFIIIMENIGSNGAVSNIDIAVSKDSNPNNGWYFASLNTSLTVNGQLTSSDRPSISVDGDNIYITAPQYNVNVSGYAGTETWVIGKTIGAGGGLYNGGTMTVVANQITSANQGIFAVAAGNNGKTYYACDYSTGSEIVAVVQVYDTATSTFGPATTISLGNIDQGGAYTAQQQGTTLLLDAGDKRIQNLQYANGFLWGVCELKPIGSSVPLVHWFKIDVSNPSNPILVAQGDISGASLGTNVATFNSSLAVDAAGDVVINFTASGPNMYPSDYYVYQAVTDPTFSAPILYQASTGFFNSGNGSSVQRWGAYSTAIPDPNNPNAVWISNEYVANGWWQTAISQIEITSASVPTTASIETSFSGISDTSGILPHNALAVGPNYIVTLESSRIQWTDLTGGAQALQSVYQFFKPLGAMATNALFDPRVVYDNVNNRYIVTMDNIGSGGTISNIDIAVSKDSNPNDGWYFASLNTSLTINGQLTSSDTPVVSVDGSNIYITAPQYNVNASGWQGTAVWVIGDTVGAGGGIYNGGTTTVVASKVMPSSQGIYRVVAGNNGKTYFASSYSTGSQIVVSLQIYDVATGTFGPTNVIGLGKIDQGGSYTAQQLGTNLLLDATDKRIQNLAYANGFLYGVMEEKPIGSSVPLVHWFKIDVSNPNAPALIAQGDISGASIGTNVATFNASIAANDAGDVIINFTASGPNMYPSDYYVFRSVSDASGSFSAPALYQPSTNFFNSGNGSSVQRWGINSTAIVDPNNPHSFWISNEYVANGWWQTAVSQVQLQTAPEASALTLGTAALTVNAEGSASTTTASEMATSAPQTIVTTDPPAVFATAAGTAPADHGWGTNSHVVALDRFAALMDQYMAAGLKGASNANFDQIVDTLSAHAGFEDLPLLSASYYHHHHA